MYIVELDTLVIWCPRWFVDRLDCVPEFFSSWSTAGEVIGPFVLSVCFDLVVDLRI